MAGSAKEKTSDASGFFHLPISTGIIGFLLLGPLWLALSPGHGRKTNATYL